MKTIRTVLLDMGNVLVDYVPTLFCAYDMSDIEKVDSFVYRIFYTQAWLDADLGIISEEECLFQILKNFAIEDHELVKKIFWNWDEKLHAKEGIPALLKALKKKKLKLILASNASVRYHRYLHRIDGLELLDDIVYSCDLKLAKPNPDFYNYIILNKAILPEETLFIDDSLENCRAAHDLGFRTYHSNGDVKSLIQYLKFVNIL